MRPNIPLIPLGAAALVRGLATLAATAARWLKEYAQARRNRRQAIALANLDGRMLSDLGLTRSDVSDAFSSPFWEDPTSLLRERALERRLGYRPRSGAFAHVAEFNRSARRVPPIRPARRAV